MFYRNRNIKKSSVGLIVLVIVVLGVLLIGSTSNKTAQLPAPEILTAQILPAQQPIKAPITSICGFKITSPLPNEVVQFPLIISGVYDSNFNTSNCTWVAFEGIAGTVKVVGSNNNQVGFSGIPLGPNWLQSLISQTPLPIPFSFTVSLTGVPTANLDLVFTEDTAAGGSFDTFTIPVKLSAVTDIAPEPQAVRSSFKKALYQGSSIENYLVKIRDSQGDEILSFRLNAQTWHVSGIQPSHLAQKDIIISGKGDTVELEVTGDAARLLERGSYTLNVSSVFGIRVSKPATKDFFVGGFQEEEQLAVMEKEPPALSVVGREAEQKAPFLERITQRITNRVRFVVSEIRSFVQRLFGRGEGRQQLSPTTTTGTGIEGEIQQRAPAKDTGGEIKEKL